MKETIAAIATPVGRGGIGIVRVSGELSLVIMKKLMAEKPAAIEPRRAYYSGVVNPDTNEFIDEAIFIYMKAPHSYTCEDVLEIQAHGSQLALREILRAVMSCGARLAEPGEFTKLAFLNGRIDLAQAEAVIDVITAKSELPKRIASRQLEGALSREVIEIRAALVDVLAEMAVNIDFPDEDIEQFTYNKFITALDGEQDKIDKLIRSAERGRLAREGLKVAIVGRPNVGKSSLMNALLGENRVIVTDIPGTTRDTVEESISIGGMPVVLIDTAGMHESEDKVEAIGIDRSRAELDDADMVIFVIDGSESLTAEDMEIAELIKSSGNDGYAVPDASAETGMEESTEDKGMAEARIRMHPFGSKRVVAVLNKRDRGALVSEADVRKALGVTELSEDLAVVKTSLFIGSGSEQTINSEKFCGAEAVKDAIYSMMEKEEYLSEAGNTVTNERHREALIRANASLVEAISLLKNREALEIAEVEARAAFEKLGEIIGESAGEEILDAVFSRFCLGK